MTKIENYGIITSISWNSNNWQDEPTDEDLAISNYGFVKENAHAHEALNFGHDIYPEEADGYYIAYSPIFNRLPSEQNARNVSIVFFISTNHQKQKMLVGCYGYPTIGKFNRTAKHRKYKTYYFGNVASEPKHIIYFDNPIEVDNEMAQQLALLPEGKKFSQRGFNYIHSDNVMNILRLAFRQNHSNKTFKKLINNLMIDVGFTEDFDTDEAARDLIKDTLPDSLKSIAALEKRMQKAIPKVKERISQYIERGKIAQDVKRLTNYKCLICEQLGENPHSFKKTDGTYYIEAHHVVPVAKKKKGSLSINNLITVCANHHRQLHHGNSKVIVNGNKRFVFEIDGREIEVMKISVETD